MNLFGCARALASRATCALAVVGAGAAFAAEVDGLVEYLESTGSQYIDTGHVFTKAPLVEARMMLMTRDDLDVAGTPAAKEGCFIVDYKDSQIYYRYGTSGYRQLETPYSPYNQWMDCSWGVDFVQKGEKVGTVAAADFSANTQSFYLFGGRNKAKVRFGEVKMYDGGVLVRHFLPAVKDGRGCMLDVCTGEVYENAGTGDFAVGATVLPKMTVSGAPTAFGTVTPAYGTTELTLGESVGLALSGARTFDDGVTAYPSADGRARARFKEVVYAAIGPSETLTETSFTRPVAPASSVDWRFENAEYAVQASARGDGTVTLDGGAAAGTAVAWKDEGASVTLTATAADGSFFYRWSGEDADLFDPADVYKPTLTLTVDRPLSLTAVFAAGEHVVLPYIGSTGTQYVDTEYVFTNRPLVKARAMIMSTADCDIAGTPAQANGCFIIDYFLGNGGVTAKFFYRYSSSGSTSAYAVQTPTPIYQKWVDFEWGPVVTQDGETILEMKSWDFSVNRQTFWLFAGRTKASVRFGEITMYDGDELVRHFYPVFRNGKGCLYETCEGKYYENKGTGDFEIGEIEDTKVTVTGSPDAFGVPSPSYGESEAMRGMDVTYSLSGARTFDDGVTAYTNGAGTVRAAFADCRVTEDRGEAEIYTSIPFVRTGGDVDYRTVEWRFRDVDYLTDVSSPMPAAGSVELDGVAGDRSAWLRAESAHTVRAVPAAGYSFVGWRGDIEGLSSKSAPELAFVADRPRVLRAVFCRTGELSAYSYSQRGLVACWDAIDNAGVGEHRPSETAWTDLVDGRRFELYGADVNDKAISFTGVASSYGVLGAADTSAVFTAPTTTVETVAAFEGSGSFSILFKGPQASGVALCVAEGKPLVTSATSHLLDVSALQTNVYQVVYTNGYPAACYVNDASATFAEATNDCSGDGPEAWIGKRGYGNAYPTSGKLLAIRIYHRALSRGELSRNAWMDRRRFFGERAGGFTILVR